MIDHTNDDEALSRLRASDPATGSHPDLHSLRRRIGAKAPASQAEGDTVISVDDEEFRGPRLRAPWIAAAAVAALGIGAGGYALGAQSVDRTPTAGQQADQRSDTAGGDRDDSLIGGMAAQGADEASATAAPPTSGGGSSSGASFDPGPVRLAAAPGLSDERTTAEVRALTSDTDPATFVKQWAQRLDLNGTALKPSAEGWYGPNTIVNTDDLRMVGASSDNGGALSFNYEDMLHGPYCSEMFSGASDEDLAMARSEWAKGVGEDVPFPDPSRCVKSSGPAPSEEEALATAKEFLATTGLDLAPFDLKVMDYHDPETNMVQIEGYPDGMQQGQLALNVQVGPEGVVSAWGNVGEMTSLGEYPVISPKEAVERYAKREFSMDYGVTLDEDMKAMSEDKAMEMPAFEMPEPAKVEPGMKIPLLLKDKVVTKAELTKGTMWTQTGGTLEVPTWKLITEDGMHYAVMAVAEESIDWNSWN